MRCKLARFLASAAALVCLIGHAGTAQADTKEVHLRSNFFTPSEVTIATGDTIRWIWDMGSHTTTSVDGLWDSGVKGAGSTFEYTFNDPGDFGYVCTLHLNCCNMAAIIHVVKPVSLAATLDPTNIDPNASGEADYQKGRDGADFTVTVADISSTDVVDVFINGNFVGTIFLNAGGGQLILDTQNGDFVPDLQEGDEVEVVDANDDSTLILVGTLVSTG
jgi:plastocyanin